MRIGIDFDNTIACYEGVFHAAARRLDLLPDGIGTSKNSVRDYLEANGQADEFTKLQGYVYGASMDLVSPYPGVIEFLKKANGGKHTLFIVSHKTQYPVMGIRYDMHGAAREFLEKWGIGGEKGLVSSSNVFFEETKV